MSDEKEVKLNPFLNKILHRMMLSFDELPQTLEQWQLFIGSVTNLIHDYEQERYLLERSMELSSREMRELYEEFEIAQSIASIGYWHYDKTNEKIIWSKEMYHIAGVDSTNAVPKFNDFIQYVHEDDRKHLLSLIERAFKQGIDYEIEFRIYHQPDNQVRWVYAKGHPEKIKGNDGQIKSILSSVLMDISTRKKTESDLKRLNQQLVEISRLSGMSEIATSILHNIGNVLNSVNVSIAVMDNIMKNSGIKNLTKVSDCIHENIQGKPDFFVNDPKGKLIPEYLKDLSGNINLDCQKINAELENLKNNVQHIKDIVNMQNDISGVSGINEITSLTDIIDTAISIGARSAEKMGIKIIKDYTYAPFLNINRSRLLQILVNLISNARDALHAENNNLKKKIDIKIRKNTETGFVEISVEDNGVGILHEDLNKIFSMGYTSKPKGHGFGLHSSALAAKELRGRLSVKSEGRGWGAMFLLELPDVVDYGTRPDNGPE